jgi:hypothetical protein
MRQDRREREARAHDPALLARRDPELLIQHRDHAQPLVHRGAREAQAHPAQLLNGVARPVVVVHLEDQARAGRNQHADTVGHRHGPRAGRPTAQALTRADKARAAEARVAGACVRAVEGLRLPGGVDVGEQVMHDATVTGQELGGGDVAILRERRGDDEAAVARPPSPRRAAARISVSASRRSSMKSPWPGTGGQGGIFRRSTARRIFCRRA